MEAIYRDFGRRLRKVRRDAALTQEALGKRVGLTRTSITNIEQGNQHVGLHLLYALARAVGAAPVDLLPDEATATSDAEELAQVLGGMRRSDRARVKHDMQQLSEDDQMRILRLVREEARDDSREG